MHNVYNEDALVKSVQKKTKCRYQVLHRSEHSILLNILDVGARHNEVLCYIMDRFVINDLI